MTENTEYTMYGYTFLAIMSYFFQILKIQLFSSLRELQNDMDTLFITILDLELKFETWDQNTDFPDFSPKSLIKSLVSSAGRKKFFPDPRMRTEGGYKCLPSTEPGPGHIFELRWTIPCISHPSFHIIRYHAWLPPPF